MYTYQDGAYIYREEGVQLIQTSKCSSVELTRALPVFVACLLVQDCFGATSGRSHHWNLASFASQPG
jgi:hypothetical protein